MWCVWCLLCVWLKKKIIMTQANTQRDTLQLYFFLKKSWFGTLDGWMDDNAAAAVVGDAVLIMIMIQKRESVKT